MTRKSTVPELVGELVEPVEGTLTRAATLIQYGLVSNNDQLIREGIQILEQTGYEKQGIFAPLVQAKTDEEYRVAKRKLYTYYRCMTGGKRR